MKPAAILAIALSACAPAQPTPSEIHAADMIRRGYVEWAVRCAWSDGRAGHKLDATLRRCQMDLGIHISAQNTNRPPIVRRPIPQESSIPGNAQAKQITHLLTMPGPTPVQEGNLDGIDRRGLPQSNMLQGISKRSAQNAFDDHGNACLRLWIGDWQAQQNGSIPRYHIHHIFSIPAICGARILQCSRLLSTVNKGL